MFQMEKLPIIFILVFLFLPNRFKAILNLSYCPSLPAFDDQPHNFFRSFYEELILIRCVQRITPALKH